MSRKTRRLERHYKREEELARLGLLTTSEAAHFLRVSLATLRSWRHRGRGPAFITLGKVQFRYTFAALMEWVRWLEGESPQGTRFGIRRQRGRPTMRAPRGPRLKAAPSVSSLEGPPTPAQCQPPPTTPD